MVTTNTGRVLQDALDQLREERARLDNAIADLERLLATLDGGRVGRVGAVKSTRAGNKAKRKGWSAQARRAAALRMKRYWAERRKQSTNNSK